MYIMIISIIDLIQYPKCVSCLDTTTTQVTFFRCLVYGLVSQLRNVENVSFSIEEVGIVSVSCESLEDINFAQVENKAKIAAFCIV